MADKGTPGDLEPLDLEPLDLEPIGSSEQIAAPNYELLKTDCVKACIRNDKNNPFPCAFLDPDLGIAWHNEAFESTFPEEEHKGPSLFSFLVGTPESIKEDIFKTLKEYESGHAWTGRIEVLRKNISTLFANLLIGPIYQKDSPEGVSPIGYRVVIDDVTSEHNNLIRDTFASLLEASLLKDQDTGMHVSRINGYSSVLAEALAGHEGYEEIDREFLDTIGFTAAMHDVGKLGTPDDILNKDGPLEDWEWEVMREHTINGAYILATYPSAMAKQIALFHHEKWNGSGYPYGWNETLIPLPARIVALADVYDALRMKRSYKPAFSHSDTMAEIEKGIGEHFDPDLAAKFIALEAEMNNVFEVNKE